MKLDGAKKTNARFTGLSPGREYTVEVYTFHKDKESEKVIITGRTGECGRMLWRGRVR